VEVVVWAGEECSSAEAVSVAYPVVEAVLPWSVARVQVAYDPLGLEGGDVGSYVHDAAATFALWEVARCFDHVPS